MWRDVGWEAEEEWDWAKEGKLSKNYVNCSFFPPFSLLPILIVCCEREEWCGGGGVADDYYGEKVFAFWGVGTCVWWSWPINWNSQEQTSYENVSSGEKFFSLLSSFHSLRPPFFHWTTAEHTKIEFPKKTQTLLLPIKWFVQLGDIIGLGGRHRK